MLDAHELRKKIVTYVRDEGFYANTMIISLKSIVSCNVLGLKESFQGTCFDHTFSKMCEYATTYEKVCKCLRYVSIKVDQGDLPYCMYLYCEPI